MTRHFTIANSRVLTHILFWVGYMALYTGVHADGGERFLHYFLGELEGLPAAILVAYVNLYVLFPFFFARRKYLLYVAGALLVLFAGAIVTRVMEENGDPFFYARTGADYFYSHTIDPIFTWSRIFKTMTWLLSPVLLLTLVIRIFQQSFMQEQQQQELAKEKLAAELDYLKAQIHPHFLFNTLNNLYALTLEASPVAPAVVLKLSGLVSYMLYDSQAGEIALEKEIAHIRNYMELETLRYGNRLDVSLNVSGETGEKMIAPLLLVPFVENAFKHGVSNETDNVWVTIDLKVKNGWLQMKVENSAGDHPKTGDKSGIGLQNVNKRLQLLYPQLHELVTQKEAGRYMVDLKIKLV